MEITIYENSRYGNKVLIDMQRKILILFKNEKGN